MSAGAVQQRSLESSSAEPTPVAVPGLAELYEQEIRYVWRCLRSLGVPDHELDDAIQDVFLVVQRKLPQFDGRVSPRTWIYAIGIRIARRYLERRRRQWREGALDEEPAQGVATPGNTETEFDHRARLVCARQALNALDAGKREVFVLAQVEQMSAPEIAEVTGVPVNTVYSRLRAARSAFAAEVARLEACHRRSP